MEGPLSLQAKASPNPPRQRGRARWWTPAGYWERGADGRFA
jgi:hypothetical protein